MIALTVLAIYRWVHTLGVIIAFRCGAARLVLNQLACMGFRIELFAHMLFHPLGRTQKLPANATNKRALILRSFLGLDHAKLTAPKTLLGPCCSSAFVVITIMICCSSAFVVITIIIWAIPVISDILRW